MNIANPKICAAVIGIQFVLIFMGFTWTNQATDDSVNQYCMTDGHLYEQKHESDIPLVIGRCDPRR